jgi:hypothetical protein
LALILKFSNHVPFIDVEKRKMPYKIVLLMLRSYKKLFYCKKNGVHKSSCSFGTHYLKGLGLSFIVIALVFFFFCKCDPANVAKELLVVM